MILDKDLMEMLNSIQPETAVLPQEVVIHMGCRQCNGGNKG